MSLLGVAGEFRLEHGGEVEDGHVVLAVVVGGKLQCGQLVSGDDIGHLSGTLPETIPVNVVRGQ